MYSALMAINKAYRQYLDGRCDPGRQWQAYKGGPDRRGHRPLVKTTGGFDCYGFLGVCISVVATSFPAQIRYILILQARQLAHYRWDY